MPSQGQDVRLRMIVPPPLLPIVESASLLLNLDAYTLQLGDGDPVSSWLDSSGNGNDFGATGTKPFFRSSLLGYPAVQPASGSYMIGPNFADNPQSMCIFQVSTWITGQIGTTISKLTNMGVGNGWLYYSENSHIFVQDGDGANWLDIRIDPVSYNNVAIITHRYVSAAEIVSYSDMNLYIDGVKLDNEVSSASNVVTDISCSTPVVLFQTFDLDDTLTVQPLHQLLIYSPAPNVSDRARITSWLAARYGITLP